MRSGAPPKPEDMSAELGASLVSAAGASGAAPASAVAITSDGALLAVGAPDGTDDMLSARVFREPEAELSIGKVVM